MDNDRINLYSEDLRWAKMVRDAIKGLSAQADMQCEGCDSSWLAMHYSLESLGETMDSIIKDMEDRLNAK